MLVLHNKESDVNYINKNKLLSEIITECDFDKYPNLIKFPSIDLNYSQIVSYRREILLNKLLNEDS